MDVQSFKTIGDSSSTILQGGGTMMLLYGGFEGRYELCIVGIVTIGIGIGIMYIRHKMNQTRIQRELEVNDRVRIRTRYIRR